MAAHEYVKYIQYTLASYGSYTSAIDGSYGPVTAAAVKSFQINFNQRYIDGKVDSETKWYLAKFWLNMKKDDLTRFNAWKAYASDDIKKYIVAVENMGLSSSVNNGGLSYGKITFTGFEGPSTGTDVIYFEVRDELAKINKIIIKPDESASWKNFKVTYYGFSSKPIQSLPNGILDAEAHITPLNLDASSGEIVINFPEKDYAEIRYMYICVSAGKSSYYGSFAETFSIKSIEAKGRTMISPAEPADPGETPPAPDPLTSITLRAEITTENLNVTNISISNDRIISYDTSTLPKDVSYISAVSTFDNDGNTLNTYPLNRDVYLNESSDIVFTIGNLNDPTIFSADITFNPRNLTYVKPDVNATVIKNVSSTNGSALVWEESSNAACPVSFTSINLPNLETAIKFTTNSLYYVNNELISSPNEITTYRLKNLSNTLLPGQPNTVTVNDGVILLCDNNGAPIGIPNLDTVRAQVVSGADEVYLEYGLLALKNSLEMNGLIYSFYNFNERKFIGKTISYLDYITAGPGNVYVGLCAYDADGVTQNKNEYFGRSTSITFKPVNVPVKCAAPIYSVKVNNSASIRVEKPSNTLSKYDVWPMLVKSGSFFKKITLPEGTVSIYDYEWSPYSSRQTLLCKYSTLNLDCNYSSKIYGQGYHDIKDETPLFIDSKTIKLKNFPIAIFNYPTNYRSSIFGIARPIVKIYTRNSKNDPWTELSYSAIKDIDCENGIIYFYDSIVSVNDLNKLVDLSLMKVDYSIKSNYLPVRQTNGNPIPLNPFINDISEEDYNKPIYVYLNPVEIYRESSIDGANSKYVKVSSSLQQGNSINWTYESNMFNSNSEQYNPFLIPIAVFYRMSNTENMQANINDIRVKGGGLSRNFKTLNLMSEVHGFQDVDENVTSYWDVYSPSQETYPKGGYVIIKLPEEIKENFLDEKEIYQIISNNLTAGVVYDLQDMDGNTWN